MAHHHTNKLYWFLHSYELYKLSIYESFALCPSLPLTLADPLWSHSHLLAILPNLCTVITFLDSQLTTTASTFIVAQGPYISWIPKVPTSALTWDSILGFITQCRHLGSVLKVITLAKSLQLASRITNLLKELKVSILVGSLRSLS